MELIQIKNLQRIYRTLDAGKIASEQVIFNDLTLDIGEGEFVAVVGPSGCGKSTLLNMIGGLDTVERTVRGDTEGGDGDEKGTSVALVEGKGSITIGDFPISRAAGDSKADFINKNIGFVFQFHHLIPELTTIQNVSLPMRIAGKSVKESSAAAQALLERVGMGTYASKRPEVLSGGEKQRVAIARALINSPRLLLADEPTGSLDPTLKQQVFDILLELNQRTNVTIILVSHDVTLLYDDKEQLQVDRKIDLAKIRL